MGFFDFLKAKKGQKQEEFESQANFGQLPPLSSESELYSELPSLPEAPETSGFPEIELPPPLKGLEGFDFPEVKDVKAAQETAEIQPAAKYGQYKPLIPAWPKSEEPKLPDLPAMPEATEEKPWENTHAEVPELQMQETEPIHDFRGSLISHKNSFFLKSDDFRTVKSDIDDIIRIQKKHHKLTDIKKEENAQFEHMSIIIEDAQRKLMHLDRTLFE